MTDIYDNITWTDVSAILVDHITDRFNISKSAARKYILNALCYNVVISELENQVAYMLGEDGE